MGNKSSLQAKLPLIHIYDHTRCTAHIILGKCVTIELPNLSRQTRLCSSIQTLNPSTKKAAPTVSSYFPWLALSVSPFLPNVFLSSRFQTHRLFALTSPLLFCSLTVSGESLSICVWPGVCLCLCVVLCARMFSGCVLSMWPWLGPNRCRLNGYEWSCE